MLKEYSLCRFYKVCVSLCVYMSTSEVGGKLDYSPVSWREYYDEMEDVNVGPADSKDVFRIYKAGSEGPLLVLLHGGGHSALSWAVFTVSICTVSWLTEPLTGRLINDGYILNNICVFLCCRQPSPAEWTVGCSPWTSGVMVSNLYLTDSVMFIQITCFWDSRLCLIWSGVSDQGNFLCHWIGEEGFPTVVLIYFVSLASWLFLVLMSNIELTEKLSCVFTRFDFLC